MRAAHEAETELERQHELERFQMLDTQDDAVFTEFASIAAIISSTKLASITFVDAERTWHKARIGFDIREIPRNKSLSELVVESNDVVVISDVSENARFADYALVSSPPHIRFFAGVPLTTSEGYTLGSLNVFDTKPRTLTDDQILVLRTIARAVMETLEGRRRYLSLFDSAHIDVFTINPHDATIAFASRQACRRLGYSIRELVGMPIFDVMPAITDATISESIARARAGEEVVRETEVVRRNGTTYSVELRIDSTRAAGEERIFAMAFDLTQRKLQQREIDLLLGAVNIAGDVIIVYEVDDNGELTLEYMNDAYTHQSGYTRDEAIGRALDWFRQAMPDDEGMRVIRAGLAHGEPVQAEIVSYRKDGSTYWNAITLHPMRGQDGRISHWISVERDISDEVTRTSALAEEHDRLVQLTRAARRLFTALDTHVLVSTLCDVTEQLLHAKARVIAVRDDGFSVAVDEVGLANWDSATRDEMVERAVTHRMRILDETESRAVTYAARVGEGRYALEIRTLLPRTLRNTDLFVFDLIAEYFAVAARNVSLYHELDERRAAVLELNQTKSDLITMLAHDFRGPLTSIVGFADLTSEVDDVSDEQREYLDTIKRSAVRLSDLATDTLTLSRLERNEVALTLGEVDVAELARSIVQQGSDRRSVQLDVEGDAHVTGDDERLRQVFANLVDNAIKYSPRAPDPQVRVEGRQDDVTITVRDFGIGIPAGEISRVFDRFSRASNARKARISGTGFGLFLTKQLVQLHGGTIAVESEEGKGSVFTVTLPRRFVRSAAPRTVVVMDPDRDRSFLAYGLQEAGYRVLTANALEDVLGIADAQPVDVLIVANAEDLSRGAAVQLRAFSRERGVPMIAIGESKGQLGAAATLQRPVLIGDVVTALERLSP